MKQWNDILNLVGMASKTRSGKLPKNSARDAGRLMRQAAKVLEDREWLQGTLQSGNAFCMRGAIYFALCGNSSPRFPHRLATVTEILFSKWVETPSVMGFNDHIGRTKEEVLETMYKFAEEHDPQ